MKDYWWLSIKLSIVSKSAYLYIPIIVNQQVWGFQISMNYCRYTSVQAIHAFGHIKGHLDPPFFINKAIRAVKDLIQASPEQGHNHETTMNRQT
jgi:hypothetical protein